MKKYEAQEAGSAEMEDRVFILKDGAAVQLEVEDDAGGAM